MIKVDLKKIFYMDYLIHIRKTGTAAEFATKVGVARSTFFEYMDYMRNEAQYSDTLRQICQNLLL